MQKSLLRALLMPWGRLRAAENTLDFTARLTLTEEFKDLPFGAIWAAYCERLGTPSGLSLMGELESYQAGVASRG
jgi:L-rhamnose isomerase